MRCRDYPAPLLEHLTIHIYHSMLDGPSYVSSSGTISTSSASSSGESFTLYGAAAAGSGNGSVGAQAQAASKLTPLPLFAGQTPMLKTCSFTSFNFGWDVGMVRRLKVLRLGGYFNGYAPTLSALAAVLRECPELEDLSLRNLSEGDGEASEMGPHGGNHSSCDSPIASRLGCGGHHGGTSISALTSDSHVVSATSKTISLPKLRSLTLYYATPAHHLLPLLSLPGLQHLTLAFLQNISSVLQGLYTQALTRLPLKTIRIESCIFNEIVFINLMRRLNGLVRLEMVDCEDLSGGALRVRHRLILFSPSSNQICIYLFPIPSNAHNFQTHLAPIGISEPNLFNTERPVAPPTSYAPDAGWMYIARLRLAPDLR